MYGGEDIDFLLDEKEDSDKEEDDLYDDNSTDPEYASDPDDKDNTEEKETVKLDVYRRIVADQKGIPIGQLVNLTKEKLTELLQFDNDDIKETINDVSGEKGEILRYMEGRLKELLNEIMSKPQDKELLERYRRLKYDFLELSGEEVLPISEVIEQLKTVKKEKKFMPLTKKQQRLRVKRRYYKEIIAPYEAGYIGLKTEDTVTNKRRIVYYLEAHDETVKWSVFLNDNEKAVIFSQYSNDRPKTKLRNQECITVSDFKRVSPYLTTEQLSTLSGYLENESKRLEEESQLDPFKITTVRYYVNMFKYVSLKEIFCLISNDTLVEFIPGYNIDSPLNIEAVNLVPEPYLSDLLTRYKIESTEKLMNIIRDTFFIKEYEKEVKRYNSEPGSKRQLTFSTFNSKIIVRLWPTIEQDHKERIIEYFRNLNRRKFGHILPHDIISRKVKQDIQFLSSVFDQNIKYFTTKCIESKLVYPFLEAKEIEELDSLSVETIEGIIKDLFENNIKFGSEEEVLIREFNYYRQTLNGVISPTEISDNFIYPWEITNILSEQKNIISEVQKYYDKLIRDNNVPLGIIFSDLHCKSVKTSDLLMFLLNDNEGIKAVNANLEREYTKYNIRRSIELKNSLSKKKHIEPWLLEDVSLVSFITERTKKGWKYETIKSFYKFYLYQHLPFYDPGLSKLTHSNVNLDNFIEQYFGTEHEYILFNTLDNLEASFTNVNVKELPFIDIALSIVSLFTPFVNVALEFLYRKDIEGDIKESLEDFSNKIKSDKDIALSMKELLEELTDNAEVLFLLQREIIERLSYFVLNFINRKLESLVKQIRRIRKPKRYEDSKIESVINYKKILEDMFLRTTVVRDKEILEDYTEEDIYDRLASRIISYNRTPQTFEQWFQTKEMVRKYKEDEMVRNIFQMTTLPAIYHIDPHKKLKTITRGEVGINIMKQPTKQTTEQVLKKRKPVFEMDIEKILDPSRIGEQQEIEDVPLLTKNIPYYTKVNIPQYKPRKLPREGDNEYIDLKDSYKKESVYINIGELFAVLRYKDRYRYTSKIEELNREEVDELIVKVSSNINQVNLFYLITKDYLPFKWFKNYVLDPENIKTVHNFDTLQKVSPEIWFTKNPKRSYESITKYINNNIKFIETSLLPYWKGAYVDLLQLTRIPVYRNIALRLVGNNMVFLNKSKEFWAENLIEVKLIEQVNMEDHGYRYSKELIIPIKSAYEIESRNIISVSNIKVNDIDSLYEFDSSPCVYCSIDLPKFIVFTLQDCKVILYPQEDQYADNTVAFHSFQNFSYTIPVNSNIPGMIANGYLIYLKGEIDKLLKYNVELSRLEELNLEKTVKDCYTDGNYLYLRVSESSLDNEYIVYDKTGIDFKVKLGFYSMFKGRIYYYMSYFHYFEALSFEPGNYSYKGYFDLNGNFSRLPEIEDKVSFLTMSYGIINGKCSDVSPDNIKVLKDNKSKVLFVYSRNVVRSWVYQGNLYVLSNNHVENNYMNV